MDSRCRLNIAKGKCTRNQVQQKQFLLENEVPSLQPLEYFPFQSLTSVAKRFGGSLNFNIKWVHFFIPTLDVASKQAKPLEGWGIICLSVGLLEIMKERRMCFATTLISDCVFWRGKKYHIICSIEKTGFSLPTGAIFNKLIPLSQFKHFSVMEYAG